MNEEYIKMCEKAKGDLETIPEYGSWYWVKNIPDKFKVGNECKALLVTTTPISWHLIVPSRHDKGEVALVFDNWNQNSTFIWLPTQAQLQDMLGGFLSCMALMERRIKGEFPSEYMIGSMEELWLTILMRKNYGKVWDGKMWIKGGV